MPNETQRSGKLRRVKFRGVPVYLVLHTVKPSCFGAFVIVGVAYLCLLAAHHEAEWVGCVVYSRIHVYRILIACGRFVCEEVRVVDGRVIKHATLSRGNHNNICIAAIERRLYKGLGGVCLSS